MNRLGFMILSILRSNGATNQVQSMTVREIASVEEFDMKENTVFKKLKGFEQSGYIGRGFKEGRADTFFITPDGCEYLERVKK